MKYDLWGNWEDLLQMLMFIKSFKKCWIQSLIASQFTAFAFFLLWISVHIFWSYFILSSNKSSFWKHLMKKRHLRRASGRVRPPQYKKGHIPMMKGRVSRRSRQLSTVSLTSHPPPHFFILRLQRLSGHPIW